MLQKTEMAELKKPDREKIFSFYNKMPLEIAYGNMRSHPQYAPSNQMLPVLDLP
jgi:hypothetical protein